MRSAPGRVNLIGEHTDYAGGLVLPFAIDLRTTATTVPNQRDCLRIRSREHPNDPADIDLVDVDAGRLTGWSAYAAGVVAILRRHGHAVGGADISIESDVPEGAGLSSSAALECAVAAAVSDAFSLGLRSDEIAAVAHAAETDVVGVPCGVMDQLVSVHARPAHVLLIDCTTMTMEPIPFDPTSCGLDVLVVDTRVRHALADGAYAERQRWLFEAASDSDVHRRASRHVDTENARVRAAVDVLRQEDWPALGRLLAESHASLRDDLAVSCAQLDLAVETLMQQGALGARMTGAGFGGSVIGLVPTTRVPEVRNVVCDAFGRMGFSAPDVRLVRPSAGLSARESDVRPT